MVEKELGYEQLAIKEEMMKETKEEKALQSQIEVEKEREVKQKIFLIKYIFHIKETVEKELIKKERFKKLANRQDELEEKIKDIQKQALLQVKQARAKTQEKLDQMEKAAERRKKEARRRITDIRSKIATKLLNEAKTGNITLCNPKQSEEDRLNYCEKNMKDDYQKLNDCKNDREDFCYTCCENEFGRIHEDLRDQCYLKCDDFANNKEFIDWNKGNEVFKSK